MAVTQYIGARYVPLFYENPNGTNEWLSGIAYDPLTIVTYLTQSFTSKKPVPAGIGNPADNPEYWSQTGAYNAQVEQYRQEVEDLSDHVDDIEDVLETKATDYHDKFYLFIGDSYMSVASSFVEIAMTKLGITSYYKAAVSGYGFLTNPGFTDLLTAASSQVTPEDVTDVIVLGGANDAPDINNIHTGIETFVTAAHTIYPNAELHIGVCDWTVNIPFTYGAVVREYNKAAIAAGAHVVDGMYMAQHSDIWKDGTGHPNAAGQAALAGCLATYLQGELVIPAVSPTQCTLTPAAGISVINDNAIMTGIAGKSVCIYKRQYRMYFTFQTAQTPAAGWTKVDIGSISNAYFFGDQYESSETPVIIDTVGVNPRTNIVAIFGVSNGVAYLKIPFVSGDNFYGINVYAFSMTMPYYSS